eukprot:GHUV01011687.1.p4 GENE.GHUV01011687.1~~GHUV01011687.1.p4  ORF type:complete len:124 (+),score=27.61 GHUV01011687.1:650-1021(+)
MLQHSCHIGHSRLSVQQIPRVRPYGCNSTLPHNGAFGRCHAAASEDASSISSDGAPSPSGRTAAASTGVWGWLKRSFGSSKLDKQKLAEYGLGEHVCEVTTAAAACRVAAAVWSLDMYRKRAP